MGKRRYITFKVCLKANAEAASAAGPLVKNALLNPVSTHLLHHLHAG
jgi:hypothetical protein